MDRPRVPVPNRKIIGLAWAGFLLVLILGIVILGRWTQPERDALATLTRLQLAAARSDLERARQDCSQRFLDQVGLEQAGEGGWVGMPRTIDEHFRIWWVDGQIWIRPTDRIGPVYQFIREAGAWRFDGLVAYDHGRGRLERRSSSADGKLRDRAVIDSDSPQQSSAKEDLPAGDRSNP